MSARVVISRNRRGDLILRGTGLAALTAAFFLANTLATLVGKSPAHQANGHDLLVATACVICGFAGGILTALGRHIFGPVEQPPRHRTVLSTSDEMLLWDLPPALDPRASGVSARNARTPTAGASWSLVQFWERALKAPRTLTHQYAQPWKRR